VCESNQGDHAGGRCVNISSEQSILAWARSNCHGMTVADRLLHQPSLTSLHGSSKSTGDTELCAKAVDAVGSVQVLHDHDLEASSAALAGSDDGPCEEEFPDLYEVKWSVKRNK
jgi:hypothetical protein